MVDAVTAGQAWLEEYLKSGRELAHHGVLGQKWGVRKDRDSSPRSSSSQSSSNKPKVAKVSTTKDTKVKKGEIVENVIGATALGATGAYYADLGVQKVLLEKDVKNIIAKTMAVDKTKDFARDAADTVLPEGTTLHRVASYKEKAINGPKYATYLDDDVLKYRNSWVTPGRSGSAKHYLTRLTANKDFTIASPNSIEKTLLNSLHDLGDDGESLYMKIKKTAAYIEAENMMTTMGMHVDLDDKTVVQNIVWHNRINVWGDDIGKATANIMKKAGYSAVTDINNTGSSVKHAVIALDDAVFKVSGTKLGFNQRFVAGVRRSSIATTAAKAASRAAKAAI